MEELGKVYQLIIPIGGYNMTFNLNVIVMTWIVFGLLFLFGYFEDDGKSPEQRKSDCMISPVEYLVFLESTGNNGKALCPIVYIHKRSHGFRAKGFFFPAIRIR